MKWEKPKLILLNNTEIAYGAVCSGGTVPGGGSGHCSSGPSAGGHCEVGNSATSHCRDGSTPGFQCSSGSGK